MRKYQPEGSAEIFHSADRNADCVSSIEAKEIRLKLKEQPDDLNSRLLLLGRGLIRRSGFLPHLVWLIDNHPKHCAHQFVHLINADESFTKARQCWLRQVRSNPDDVTVLYHAARFCNPLAADDSVRFLQRACKLDPFDDDLPYELSHVYTLMAGRYSLRKNKILAHKAVEQLKIAIDLYSIPTENDSYLAPYFSMVLHQTAIVALCSGLLDDAQQLAQLMLNHHAINTKRFGRADVGVARGIYKISTHKGHAILGLTALASGQLESAKEHLHAMMDTFVQHHTDFMLAEALLQSGASDAARQYLEHLRKNYENLAASFDKGEKATDGEREHALEREAYLRKLLKQIERGGKVGRLKT